MEKTVYIYDADGKFVSEYIAQEDPMQLGSFIAPINSTDIIPPDCTDEQYVKFKDGAWVIVTPEKEEEPQPTFDEIKQTQISLISASCIKAIDSGFEYDANTYDSDLISRTNIIGTTNAVQSGIIKSADITNWRTADNKTVQLTSTQIIELGAALLLHINTQYAKSWGLKEEIAAINDDTEENRDAIKAITWGE